MVKKRVMTISLVIGFILLTLLVWKIGLKQIFENIKSISFGNFLILLLLSITEWILHTYSWKVVLNSYHVKSSFLNLFAARMAGFTISYLTPTAFLGGEPVRAMMVKCSNKKKSAASVTVDKTIHVFSMILFIVIGIVIAIASISVPKLLKIVFILFLIGSTSFAVVIFLKQSQGFFAWLYGLLRKIKIRIKSLEKHEESIREIDSYISDFYRKNKTAFFYVFILHCIITLFFAGEIYITLLFLNAHGITFIKAFLIMTLGNLSILLPYIPASVGTYEASYAVIFVLLGLGAAVGLALTAIRRIIALLWSGIGLIVIGGTRK